MKPSVCGLIGVPCSRWQYMDAGLWDCVGAGPCDRLVPEVLVGEDLDPMNSVYWQNRQRAYRENYPEGE